MRWFFFLAIFLLSDGCSTKDENPTSPDFFPCDPVGEWLVSKLVIDLNHDGTIDQFPSGSLDDDLVQFDSDGSGEYIDRLSNSTHGTSFNWSCSQATNSFEIFGMSFDISQDSASSLKLSRYDADLGILLEVDLARP